MTPKNRKPTYLSISELCSDLHGSLHVCLFVADEFALFELEFFAWIGEVLRFPAVHI